ncbi:C-type lectin domain family 17, member A-like isoform X2 [Ruditapes philippinarum]|uniref:C-type lectin domain family 17, member A-like isoform X2 n=1 Tax=Ruditapes philippinarum TaxID=129788 RepID=UPI00295B3390|nr:C-type lectin domain family 17, member A-like isoform X2 [Ruditapes philippinarum]
MYMIMMISLALIFVLFIEIYADTSCPDAWVAYKGSCYLFAHDQSQTFTEAEHFCNQHSSHLVHINDVHENNFLQQFLTHFTSNDWWIGLSDTVIESEYKWIDSNTIADYVEWGPHEPNNNHNEDCCIINRQEGFKWADVKCSLQFQPICEKNVANENEIIG